MTAPNNKLPLIAWVFGLIAVGSSWGAIWTDGWLAGILIIAAILAVAVAVAAFAIWFRQMKAHDNGSSPEPR